MSAAERVAVWLDDDERLRIPDDEWGRALYDDIQELIRASHGSAQRARAERLEALLTALGFPRCTCHPADDDSESCLPSPAAWLAQRNAVVTEQIARAIETQARPWAPMGPYTPVDEAKHRAYMHAAQIARGEW